MRRSRSWRASPTPAADHGVVVRYRLSEPERQEATHWIACRFGGGGFERDRLKLTGVATDQAGELSDIQVYLLRQYWLGLYEAQAEAAAGRAPVVAGPVRDLLYAFQLGVNALTVGCLYGLLAIGYSLVYGIVGKINLAFGEIAIVGAYAAFIGVAVLALLGAGTLPLALLAVLLVVVIVGGVHGLATERLVFRPLRETPSQAPLIATVGLAILLQEYLRLTQGAADRWIQPVFSEAHRLAEGGGFTVTISTSQLLILGLTGVLYAGLWLLMTRSAFGRQARACADDVQMAAFCGINVERVTALTFSLGAVYAAIAGFVVLIRYGGVRFYDGFLLGFKALTAAILGGIGSVPGAMLGGLLIGALETFWAGYLTSPTRTWRSSGCSRRSWSGGRRACSASRCGWPTTPSASAGPDRQRRRAASARRRLRLRGAASGSRTCCDAVGQLGRGMSTGRGRSRRSPGARASG